MTTATRLMLGAALALAATLGGTIAGAQNYPTRPITVIIPFAGGSASDVVSRIMLDKMSKIDGPADHRRKPPRRRRQHRHRRGARRPRPTATRWSAAAPARSPPTSTLYKTLGYDPEKDLEMISPFAGFTIVVVASKNLPVNSLKELVDHAKANPGKLNYGSVGIGSSQHLAGEYFAPGHRREDRRTCPIATSRNTAPT